MGIPKFNGQLIKNLKVEYKHSAKGVPERVSGMMIDLNDLLHFFAQKTFMYGSFEISGHQNRRDKKKKVIAKPEVKTYAELEKQMIQSILSRLDYYIEEMQPEDYFIVVIDGPAPLAKIQQQRKRRYESEGNMTTPIFDSTFLSPGTELMEKIHVELEKWFVQRASEKRIPPFSCYSSFHEPGEGEHKMIDIFLRNSRQISDVSVSKEPGLHLIAGQDSDLLMLGTLMPVKNVVHYREDRDEEAKTGVPSFVLIMVDLFQSYIYSNFMRDRCIFDYVVSYFVFGNDFIPKNPGFINAADTMNDVSKAYIRNGSRLVDMKTNKIIRKNFIGFLRHLATSETERLKERANSLMKGQIHNFPILSESITKTKDSLTFDLEKFKEGWYKRCFDVYHTANKENPLQPKYTSIDEMKADMMENYLEMLQWNIDYYRRKKRVSWNFQYRFYFAPLISDLAMLSPDGEIPSRLDDTKEESSILRQLLMVVHPKRIKDYVPSPYNKLLQNPPLSHFSPNKPTFFADGYPLKSKHLFTSILPLTDNDSYDQEIFKLHSSDMPEQFTVKNSYPTVYLRHSKKRRSYRDKGENEVIASVAYDKYVWVDNV